MILAANDVAKFADDFNRAYVMLDSQEIAYEPPNGNWERRYVELPPEGLESFRGKGSVKCRGGRGCFRCRECWSMGVGEIRGFCVFIHARGGFHAEPQRKRSRRASLRGALKPSSVFPGASRA